MAKSLVAVLFSDGYSCGDSFAMGKDGVDLVKGTPDGWVQSYAHSSGVFHRKFTLLLGRRDLAFARSLLRRSPQKERQDQ